MLSMSSVSVNISDKKLENCINDCAVKLLTQTNPSSEIICETLDVFEQIIQQYISKERAKYLSLLNAKTPIKIKKIMLHKLMNDTHQDIVGITIFLGYYNNIFANMKKEDIPAYRCSERFAHIIDFLSDVLNEMNRLNAYESDIKDVLKHLKARMHVALVDFFFSHKNFPATIYHLQEKITIADSMENKRLKQSILDPTDDYILAMNYLECGDFNRVESILRLERESCVKIPQLYIDFCQKLSKFYALQEAYPQAIAWINEALSIGDIALLHIIRTELMKANVVAIDKHCKAYDKVFFLGQGAQLTESIDNLNEPDYFMVIITAINEWSPELITKFQRLSGKYAFDFAPGKLMVHKLSNVGVVGLKKIYDAINKLERHNQNHHPESTSSQTDECIMALSTSMAALEIRHPIADIASVSYSIASSSTQSCSTDPVVQDSIKPAIKLKTRGKPDKRRQVAAKAHPQIVPMCDADRYGFSRSLFGMHAFNECRMRGDSSRLFYVVTGKISASNERGENHHKFARLLAEPKIVPPCGEEGFKWMVVDGKQVLVGKALDTKKRLFPTIAQRNDQGAIAFLYGTIINTKRGIPSQSVKHYVPALKRK